MPYHQADEAPAMTRTATRNMRDRSRGGRRARRYIIILVIVVAVLVALDFGARAVAQGVMATKIQQQGLSQKPQVSIAGFPFLTQVASKDFKKVTISTHDLTEGPVTITSINATATGIRLNSYSSESGTITSVTGRAVISFASLANTLTQKIGPLGSLLNGAGLHLTDAGPGKVKASLNLLVVTGSATWRVSRISGDRLQIRLISASGVLPASLLHSMQNVTVQIPKLPLGLTISSIQVTPAGVVGVVSGHNVPFGG
jgi:LmeA-like phospholipid-binding